MAGQQRETASAVVAGCSRDRSGPGGDVLSSWAEKLSGRAGKPARGVLRFAAESWAFLPAVAAGGAAAGLFVQTIRQPWETPDGRG